MPESELIPLSDAGKLRSLAPRRFELKMARVFIERSVSEETRRAYRRVVREFFLYFKGRHPVHSKKSILRMKTAYIDCAEANFRFEVAICILLS